MALRFFILLLSLAGIFLPAYGFVPPDAVTTDKWFRQYADAAIVQISGSEKIRFEKDATSAAEESYHYFVLNEKGRRELQTFEFRYNRFYSAVEIKSVSVRRRGADGKWQTLPVDTAKCVTDKSDTSSLRSNIVDPADRKLVVVMPDVQTGDIVSVAVSRREIRPRMKGIWCGIFLLQNDFPIVSHDLEISAPAELPLKKNLIRNALPGTVRILPETRSGDRMIYRFEAENVPRLIPEPDMPPAYLSCQRLCVSTAENWQEISRWYWEVCRSHINAVSPEMRAKVKELTATSDGDDEKARAIFDFVSKEIRYMGLTAESVAPGYEPHDAAMTFAKRYGVCRDKAALLAAMLEIAGLKSRPVLFMAGSVKDSEVPDNYFNHAVAAWLKPDGRCVLMDPTDESSVSYLPAYGAECSYLVAQENGAELAATPLPDAGKSLCKVETSAEVSDTGDLRGSSTVSFTGDYDNIYRDYLSRTTPAERESFFRRALSAALPGAELDDFTVRPVNIRNTAEPLKISFTFSLKDHLPDHPGKALLNMPEIAGSVSLYRNIAGDVSLGDRKYTLRNALPFTVAETITIKLPAGVRIPVLPKNKKRQQKDIAGFECTFSFDGGVLKRTAELAVRAVSVPPEKYPEYRQLLAEFSREAAFLPVISGYSFEDEKVDFRRLFPAAGEITRRDVTDISFVAADEMLITRRIRKDILNYSGVKSNSEITIPFYPDREKVSVSAVVIPPDGKPHILSDREINIIDAPSAADTPRYPGKKLLIANLPAVAPGAAVEIEITLRRKFDGLAGFSADFTNYGIGKKEFAVTVPENSRSRVSAIPTDVAVKETSAAGNRTSCFSHWSSKYRKHESNTISAWMSDENVTVSFGSYETYARKWLNALSVKSRTASLQLDAVFAALKIKTADPLAEKLAKIRDFVDSGIRFAGPSMQETAAGAVSEIDDILRDGYGNSVDRAVVIAALLDRAGIPYKFVAASDVGYSLETVRRLNRLPQNIFTALLVKISGENIYLNNRSDFKAPIGSVAHHGCIGLDLETAKLFAINAAYKFEDRIERKVSIRLTPAGDAAIVLTKVYYGNPAAVAGRKISTLTGSELRQLIEKKVSGYFPGAVIKGSPQVDFSSHPGKIRVEIEVPGFASDAGGLLALKLPPAETGAVFAGIVPGRKTPVGCDVSLTVSGSYEIYFPAGYFPVDRRRKQRQEQIGNFNFYSDIDYERDRVVVKSRITRLPEIITPGRVRQLQEISDYLKSPEYRLMLFAPLKKGEK